MNKSDLVKKGIIQGSFPKILYKYRFFNHYTADIFKNNQLWFSKPNEFNDPFEFKISDKGGYSRSDIHDFLISGGMSTSDADKLSNQYMNDQDLLNQFIENAKGNVFERMGVLCLSKIPDNILMWSHYAENHTGFVIGFDMEEDIDFYTIPLNVIYQDDYPSISYLKEKEKIVDSCVRTKFRTWEYEQELRIIKSQSGLHKFRREALSKIIFGCKTSDSCKDNILKWIKDYRYKNVEFYQAAMSKTKYAIEINRI